MCGLNTRTPAELGLAYGQVASEAKSREKALLVHQLSVVEQQLAECSQPLQHQQQEVQQLQVQSSALIMSTILPKTYWCLR